MKVLILYYTKTGHTLEAVNAVAEGIKNAGSGVEIVNVKDFVADKVSDYDALIVGSPCWAGSTSKKAGIAEPVKKALIALKADALNGKTCGGVTVHSGAGGEVTLKNIGAILTDKGSKEYKPGPIAKAGIPLSLWKGPSVSAKDLELCKAYGTEFVK
ncbi:MAG: flavodoxin [Candidatus Poribacteria bacterium]|nr:flavodoxin [Candidatus Poribacteria bacterium]